MQMLDLAPFRCVSCGFTLAAMTAVLPDRTTDRLFRHMAWANATLIEQLAQLPAEALTYSSPGSADWSVGQIVAHFASSSGFYVARLEGTDVPIRPAPPVTADDVRAIARLCAGSDSRLLELAALPDAMTTYVRDGKTIRRARSTILAQSIHHATEHRAQIAGALAAHGVFAIDLDELDVWSYSDAEGLGA
jgi:uncharacterized damage-inducible protein DinB